jgi:hypothetical protein
VIVIPNALALGGAYAVGSEGPGMPMLVVSRYEQRARELAMLKLPNVFGLKARHL